MNNKLQNQIVALDKMSTKELSNYFDLLFGFSCGQSNCRKIRKRIAYKLQELYYGGLSQRDKDYLANIANNDLLANMNGKNKVAPIMLAGTRYSRIWHGKNYEVIATENGKFEYNGKIYRSLTAIALDITGTHWNGKKFFGVK